jgi:DNA repair exonuclease SbcCD ATPase subunit
VVIIHNHHDDVTTRTILLDFSRSCGLCSVYNGHSAAKLEKAILEYLGEFSDPIRVRLYLAAAEDKDTERYESELQRIEKRLADLDAQFLTQLDGLLKRRVLTEDEFAKANEAARSQKTDLAVRKVELSTLLQKARASEDLVQRVPQAIKHLLKRFGVWTSASKKHNYRLS